jgi:hypothetical protein
VPPLSAIVAYAIASVLVFFAGWKVFQACRPGFADVI